MDGGVIIILLSAVYESPTLYKAIISFISSDSFSSYRKCEMSLFR